MNTAASEAEKPRLPSQQGGSGCLHVAIVMGNERPGADQVDPAGFEAFGDEAQFLWNVVEAAVAAGVTHLTLLVASADRISHARIAQCADERSLLHLLSRCAAELGAAAIRLSVLGDRGAWPAGMAAAVEGIERGTRHNGRLHLTLALNYRGRAEIVDAVRRLALRVNDGALLPGEIDDGALAANLGTCLLPELDLMIRTNGEQRVGDLLLWQVAYAEMLFVAKPWQDLTIEDLAAALVEYKRRNRRFGATA